MIELEINEQVVYISPKGERKEGKVYMFCKDCKHVKVSFEGEVKRVLASKLKKAPRK